MERLKRCVITAAVPFVLAGTVYGQQAAKTTRDREAIQNVNMVGVWAIMSPPERPGLGVPSRRLRLAPYRRSHGDAVGR